MAPTCASKTYDTYYFLHTFPSLRITSLRNDRAPLTMDNNISPQEHEATPIDDDVPLQDSEEESGQHKRET